MFSVFLSYQSSDY